MTTLSIDRVRVEFAGSGGTPVVACTDIDLTVEAGEVLTIIGPSGCGKSTILHCAGGLLTPTDGRVSVDDKLLNKPDPRLASFVFQDYSLFPWKTVIDNVSMGLRFAGVGKKEALRAAGEQLEFVGLSDFAEAYPNTLSGGMQQRVAVARALALNPTFLLMDEPFGALDEQSRRALGQEMAEILGRTKQGVVLITHSLDEAVFWADRIVVMSARPGRIAEIITVEAPRPRDLSFMTSELFQDTRMRLFDMIDMSSRSTSTDEVSA